MHARSKTFQIELCLLWPVIAVSLKCTHCVLYPHKHLTCICPLYSRDKLGTPYCTLSRGASHPRGKISLRHSIKPTYKCHMLLLQMLIIVSLCASALFTSLPTSRPREKVYFVAFNLLVVIQTYLFNS